MLEEVMQHGLADRIRIKNGVGKGTKYNLITQENKSLVHSCPMHDLQQVICLFSLTFSILERYVRIVG